MHLKIAVGVINGFDAISIFLLFQVMNSLSVTCKELITDYILIASDGVSPLKVHNYCDQASETSIYIKCFYIKGSVQRFKDTGIHLALKVPRKADRYGLNLQVGGSGFMLYIGSHNSKGIISTSSSQLRVPFNQFSDVRVQMTRIKSVRSPPDTLCEDNPNYVQAECIANCTDNSGAFFDKITHVTSTFFLNLCPTFVCTSDRDCVTSFWSLFLIFILQTLRKRTKRLKIKQREKLKED